MKSVREYSKMFNRLKEWLLTVAVSLLVPMIVSGQAAKGNDEKIDVSDLEKKYWAQKDTDFSVVQNRLYTKEKRLALNLQYGFLINDTWSEGPTVAGSLSYYFSERYGIEAQFQKTSSYDNQATSSLKSNQSGTPNHGTIQSYQGLSFNFVPFYAKMSIFNQKIAYFDMAFSPGVGVTTYEQQKDSGNSQKTAPTFSIDITQTFFFSDHWAFRADYRNRWFQEEIVHFRSPNTSVSNQTSQTSVLTFGFSYFF